ncbi:cytochrome P450 [Cadophora sp. DSE1049]|nr:cytochrome P450 [Cadophora sp. DSE1049]
MSYTVFASSTRSAHSIQVPAHWQQRPKSSTRPKNDLHARKRTRLPNQLPSHQVSNNLTLERTTHQAQKLLTYSQLRSRLTQWARQYGSISSLKIFTRTIIILSSPTAIKDLLDTNSTHTSARPHSILVQRVTNGSLLALENTDTRIWKHGRKLIASFLSKDRLSIQLHTQKLESLHLMHDLLEDTTHIFEHIGRTTLSVLTSLLYGFRITKTGPLHPKTYFRSVKLLNESLDSGAHPPAVISNLSSSTNPLPEIDDFNHTPYIRALVDEVFRFRTILPLSLPHVTTQGIYYKGYRIPCDSVVFTNIHGVHHDPAFFDSPETFDPERFIKTEFGTKIGINETATEGFRKTLPFGAGRRICLGESLARRTIALNAMALLWGFTFTKDSSGTGNYDISAYSKVTNPLFVSFITLQPGIELSPKPFTCTSTPRSEAKRQMIKERYSMAFSDQTETDGSEARR